MAAYPVPGASRRPGECQLRAGGDRAGPEPPGQPAGLRRASALCHVRHRPARDQQQNQFQRLLFGVNGAWGEWNYDVGYLHSSTQLVGRRTGYLRYSRVREVLASDNNPLHAYWRLGDDAHLNNQAMYDHLAPDPGRGHHQPGHARLQGQPHAVGPARRVSLALAVGAEYRTQKVELTPLTYTDIGDIIGLGYSAYKGSEKVGVAFAEVLAPIAESIELSAALRADSYQGGDTAVTPKVGLKWTPVRMARPARGRTARASARRTRRNPAMAAWPRSPPRPTRSAAPMACPRRMAAPRPIAMRRWRSSRRIQTSSRKNPSPTPWASLINPTPSTSITIDAWQIKRSNEINQESTAAAIRAGNVVRNDNNLPGIPNSGTLLAARANYVNSASSTMQGIDFDLRQSSTSMRWASWRSTCSGAGSTSSRRIEADGTTFDYAGTHGNCDITNCAGAPKNRANAGLTWKQDRWSVSAVANYIGGFENTLQQGGGCATQFADGSNAPNGCRIPSFTSVDLSGKWKVLPKLELSASLQNAFDKIARWTRPPAARSTNPMHYSGAVGRYFTVGIRYEFD